MAELSLSARPSAAPSHIEAGGLRLPVHLCKTEYFHTEQDMTGERFGVPFVHHHSYSGGNVTASFDDYRALGEKYKSAPALIWSVLSNGGGNSNYPENFIRGLNREAVWVMDLAVVENALIGNADDNFKRYRLVDPDDVDIENLEYRGKLYVLQNKGVASSGEAALCYARCVKNVCFVGSASYGCGQYGELIDYCLPNSKLRFHMGCKVFNINGFEEGKGLYPDYWLESDDPIGELAEYIASNT